MVRRDKPRGLGNGCRKNRVGMGKASMVSVSTKLGGYQCCQRCWQEATPGIKRWMKREMSAHRRRQSKLFVAEGMAEYFQSYQIPDDQEDWGDYYDDPFEYPPNLEEEYGYDYRDYPGYECDCSRCQPLSEWEMGYNAGYEAGLRAARQMVS